MRAREYEVTVELLFTGGRKVTFPLMGQYAWQVTEEAKKLFPDYRSIDVHEVA